jgi:hypothetical protein
MSFHSFGEIFFIENTQNAQILYTHTFTIPPLTKRYIATREVINGEKCCRRESNF